MVLPGAPGTQGQLEEHSLAGAKASRMANGSSRCLEHWGMVCMGGSGAVEVSGAPELWRTAVCSALVLVGPWEQEGLSLSHPQEKNRSQGH